MNPSGSNVHFGDVQLRTGLLHWEQPERFVQDLQMFIQSTHTGFVYTN